MSTHPHDVSKEARDASGKWTAGGSKHADVTDHERSWSDRQTFREMLRSGEVKEGINVVEPFVYHVKDGKAEIQKHLDAAYDFPSNSYKIVQREMPPEAIEDRTYIHGTETQVSGAEELQPGKSYGHWGANEYNAIYLAQKVAHAKSGHPSQESLWGSRTYEAKLQPGTKIAKSVSEIRAAQAKHPEKTKQEALEAEGYDGVAALDERGDVFELALFTNKLTSAVRLSTSHDVSHEARDPAGKWTAGGNANTHEKAWADNDIHPSEAFRQKSLPRIEKLFAKHIGRLRVNERRLKDFDSDPPERIWAAIEKYDDEFPIDWGDVFVNADPLYKKIYDAAGDELSDVNPEADDDAVWKDWEDATQEWFSQQMRQLAVESKAKIMGVLNAEYARQQKLRKKYSLSAASEPANDHEAAAAELTKNVIARANAAGLAISSEVKREASELMRKLVKSNPPPAKLLSQFLDGFRAILNKYTPVLSRLISDAQIASYLQGGYGVIKRLPELEAPPESVEQIFGLRKPEDWMGLLNDGALSPSFTKFPIIAEAATDLARRELIAADDVRFQNLQARLDGFSLANVNSLDALEKMRDGLIESVVSGTTLATFEKRAADAIDESRLSKNKIEASWRTLLHGAYARGQKAVVESASVRSVACFAFRTEIDDGRLTDLCRVLSHSGLENVHGERTSVYFVQDPVFSLVAAPSHFSCRCGAIFWSVKRAAEKGILVAQKWLREGVQPPMEELCVPMPDLSSIPESEQRAFASWRGPWAQA